VLARRGPQANETTGSCARYGSSPTLARLDCSSRTLFSIIDKGSASRAPVELRSRGMQLLLQLPDEEAGAPAIALRKYFGPYPMVSKEARFAATTAGGEPSRRRARDRREARRKLASDGLSLPTRRSIGRGVRIAMRERASLSRTASRDGSENLRFSGKETWRRASSGAFRWPNGSLFAPTLLGEHGALQCTAAARKPKFQLERV